MPSPLAVTYLFNRSCPSREQGLELLAEAARRAGVAMAVEQVEVRDDAEARRRRFPGSPTYLVAGVDPIAPVEAYGFHAEACRVYALPGGRMGPLPDTDALAEALVSAAGPEEDR